MKVFIDNRELSMVSLIKKIAEPEVVQLPIGDLVIADD